MEQLFINLAEAARLCGAKSRGWVYRQARKDPTFPKLVRLGKRKTVISLSRLKHWAEQHADSTA